MPTQSISPTSPHHAITPKNSVKTKQSTNTKSGTPKKKKKKKTPVKCHDIRNFFNVSATDYFSKCTNYKNLKKQTHAASKPSNKTKQQTKACKPRVDEAPKEMIDDSDDVDMTQEDIEMKHTSDTDDHDKQINHNKPLQRPHRSIPNSPFAKLSCHVSPAKEPSNTKKEANKTVKPAPPQNTDSTTTKGKKKVTGRKRKLEEISKTDGAASDETPAKKARKFYPGFKRSDAPPQHGQTEIPTAKAYCLSGIRFVITGQLPSLTRDECSDLIKQYGGRVTSAVSGMTRYLICGEEPGQSKTEKAKAKRVTIIDEAAFLDLLRTLPAGKPPKVKLPKAPSRSKSAKANNTGQVTANKGCTSSLLVDKYKPMTSRDLVGNTKCIQQLRDFLNSWDRIKKDKDCKKRGVLLSGQPGIGKTSAIHVVAKELGFSVLEFNASDTRSKKSLRNVVQESLNNGRISDFFGVKNGAKMKKKKAKNLIIMDEVDGMSSGDRGGIKELMGYIDKSMIPMICICNDRNSQKVRSLAGHCLDLRFRKPTPYQIKNRLFAIARAEGFECDVPTIQKLAEGTNGDIRQMLHLLQFWSNGNHNGRGKQKLSFNDVNAKLKSMNQKDLTMGPWDVVPKLFYAQTPLMKGIEYYFVDYSFIPLFIHENYLNLNLYKNRTNKFTVDELSSLCAATDSMSDGDIIDHNIRKSQQYAALPYHAILSTVKPGKYVSGIGNISGRIAFPQWLGKNSSRRKNDKLCSELALNMATSTDCVALDYLMMLKQECVAPLRKGREEDIDQVVQFMKSYNIRRVDWDTIYNLQTFDKGSKGKGKSTGDIATRVKTKFTKRCNAELGAANKTIKNKKNAKRMDVNDLKVKKEDDDEYVEDEDDDDDDISKDSSIKIKAGSKSKKK
eukprot:548905_1